MKKSKVFAIPFKRKREGRTYYKKRFKLLLSNKHRLVVRKSLNNFQVSLIEFNAKGDRVLFTVNSSALSKLGWKGSTGNLPSAYLIGVMAGKKAIEKGVKEATLDLGFNNSIKGSRLYAALSGAIDAGLKVPANPEILPDKARLSGEHIAKYAQTLKNDSQKYSKQFSTYIKRGLNPEDIVKNFNEVRDKING